MLLTLISILALLIITILTATAAFYLLKVNKQKKEQQSALLELEKTANEKYQKIRNDIVFIAKAYLAEQVELAEASLRISRLVDLVIDERESRDIYQPFDVYAKAISAIPTHEDWKLLTKQERRKHEATMASLTEAHEQAAKISAKKIIGQAKALH